VTTPIRVNDRIRKVRKPMASDVKSRGRPMTMRIGRGSRLDRGSGFGMAFKRRPAGVETIT
jgi:hypothetical protein